MELRAAAFDTCRLGADVWLHRYATVLRSDNVGTSSSEAPQPSLRGRVDASLLGLPDWPFLLSVGVRFWLAVELRLLLHHHRRECKKRKSGTHDTHNIKIHTSRLSNFLSSSLSISFSPSHFLVHSLKLSLPLSLSHTPNILGIHDIHIL